MAFAGKMWFSHSTDHHRHPQVFESKVSYLECLDNGKSVMQCVIFTSICVTQVLLHALGCGVPVMAKVQFMA